MVNVNGRFEWLMVIVLCYIVMVDLNGKYEWKILVVNVNFMVNCNGKC